MQLAVVEFARHVLGYADANSTEMDPHTTHPVISLMEQQKRQSGKGGNMRLGATPCLLKTGSLIQSVYQSDTVSEGHRHRYEFNSDYKDGFEAKGMIISGQHPEYRLTEVVEICEHPWFIGVQYHPEFQSKPHQPNPLFVHFVRASLNY